MRFKDEPTKENEAFECIIIQTGKLDRVLQSLMALRAVKQLYPQLKYTMVVDESCEVAVNRVAWIDKVVAMPADDWISVVEGGERDELSLMPRVARWLTQIAGKRWNAIVNWSFSNSSSYLASLVPSEIKLGYSRNSDMTHSCVDGWSQYLQAVLDGKIPQSIHVTDILTTQFLTALQLRIGDPKDVGNASVTSKSFFNIDAKEIGPVLDETFPGTKWISLHLSHLSENKITIEDLEKLVSFILRRHSRYKICLLGDREDLVLANDLVARAAKAGLDSSRIQKMVGEYDFDVLALLISSSQWLLSSDPEMTHLASVHGTRVLTFGDEDFIFSQEGPYGNGHYIVQAVSQERLSPESIYGTWSYAASEWSHQRSKSLTEHFKQLGWSSDCESVQVSRSRIRPSSEGGGVHYERIIDRPISLQDWVEQVTGQVARSWYCGWSPPIGTELGRKAISSDFLAELRKLKNVLSDFKKIFNEALSNAAALTDLGARLRSDRIMNVHDKERLSDFGARLKQVDQMVNEIGKLHPPLRLFSELSRILMHNLGGDQLSEVGRESIDAYRQILEGMELFEEWLDYTIGLAKPRAIESTKVVNLREFRSRNE